jgi:hypothetical protein
MGVGGTTDVLEQRRVVDVADITFAEVHPAGETSSEETRSDRIFGRLAHSQIGDLREGGDQVRKPQLSGGGSPSFVRGALLPVRLFPTCSVL